MNFKPLKDRVLVIYSEEDTKTKGGLYIPEAAKEKPQQGKVESTGEDVKSIKVGNVVLFDKYSGTKIKIDEQECLIIKEEDILGVFE